MSRGGRSSAPIPVEVGVLGVCPACGGREFVPVEDGDETNFFCPSCERCWHYSLGWISRADPAACPSFAGKERCAEQFDEVAHIQ